MPQQTFGVGTVPLVLKVGERVTLICSSGCAGFISVPGEAVAQTITAGSMYDYGGYSVQREVVLSISAGTVAVNFNVDGSQFWTQSQADGLQALLSEYGNGNLANRSAQVFVAPSSIVTVSGTATLTVVNNTPVLQLPDAATTSVAFSPTLDSDDGYELFVWISATASTGTVYIGFDATLLIDGVAIPTPPTTRMFARLPIGASANAPLRFQLPLGLQKVAGVRNLISIRINRYGADGTNDTSSAVLNIHGFDLVPVVPAVDATITNGGNLPATVYQTPFNGQAVIRGLSIYTPIWTATDGVYIGEPVTISGTQQSRVAKLAKGTYAEIENVQVVARTHDVLDGHRDVSVCVDAANNVIVHGEAHHIPFEGKVGAGGSMASLSSITAPTGIATHNSYRRFFRNPYDGSIWMGTRGDSYNAAIYKWDGTNFTRTTASAMLAGDGNWGLYGMEIAFGSATTVYVLLEPIQPLSGANSGYPRQNVTVIKSTDSGANWTTLAGRTVWPPYTPGRDELHAFPTFNKLHHVVFARLAIAADGNPVVVAAWKHPKETLRSLWAAKWDGAKWVRRRLMAHNGDYSVGNAHMIHMQDGTMYVTAAWEDDHSNGSSPDGGTAAERVPNNGSVYLFKSTDGLTWTRYTIAGIPSGGYAGAYLDPEAPRIDGVLRMTPRRKSTPEASEIWQLPLP